MEGVNDKYIARVIIDDNYDIEIDYLVCSSRRRNRPVSRRDRHHRTSTGNILFSNDVMP